MIPVESSGRGRLEIVRVASRVLAQNPLGDPSERELGIYLPPSYDKRARRFPVVFFLPGFSSTGLSLCARGAFATPLDLRMNRLLAAGVAEAILVLPDCATRYGGSQYVDSPAIGAYASYIAEIVAHVDASYRTIADVRARGVIGKSSGGYGALHLAMTRPDLFSGIASHAGDCGFALSYLTDWPRSLTELEKRGGVADYLRWFETQVDKPGASIGVMSHLCCAAAWSPRASGPYGFGEGFDLPFDIATGRAIEPVWKKWLAHDPVNMVDHAHHADALKKLRLLYLDAGRFDEYQLQRGARQLAAKLSAKNIPHIHEEFDGGHRNTAHRYDRSLTLMLGDQGLITCE